MIDARRALDRTLLVIQDYVDAPDDAVVAELTGLRVRLTADMPTLACVAGQTALVAVFEAVARLGARIDLHVPSEAEAQPVPPLENARLLDGLEAQASRLITPVQKLGEVDVSFALGRSVGPTDLGLAGDSYSVQMTTGHTGAGWQGGWPFGGALAGVAAGAEVTRAAIARLIASGYAPREPLVLEAAELTLRLPALPNVTGALNLGTIDFVSGGAITHAVLFVLFRVPSLTLEGRVFDDDEAGDDNLNRYALLDESGLGVHKALHLEGLSTADIRLRGIERRVDGPESLVGIDPLAERVCVGVDSVEARWEIQKLAPGWVGVGATSHAVAMASEHWPGTPCAGCMHTDTEPLRGRLPTISFVSLAAGTFLAYRIVAAALTPSRTAESTIALNALNLGSVQPIVTEPVPPTSRCPVGCAAARALSL